MTVQRIAPVRVWNIAPVGAVFFVFSLGYLVVAYIQVWNGYRAAGNKYF